jgi:DNA-binding PadR family transcriptional regulator
MLDKVKFKLTYSQISGFILEKEYTNFLTLQQVISDLQDAELIKTDASMNRTFFSITEEGRNTLSYFGNRIGDAIIDDIDTFLSEKHLEIKNEASITAKYYKATSGEYEAELIAREKEIELVNIKISVPAEDMAETICENWYQKNEQIYKYLMEELI